MNIENWGIGNAAQSSNSWDMPRIEKLVRENEAFRIGIVKLFFEGVTASILHLHLSPREAMKLSVERMSFDPRRLAVTLVDYGLYYELTQDIVESMQTLTHRLEQ